MRTAWLAALLLLAAAAGRATIPPSGPDQPLAPVAYAPSPVSLNPRLATDGSGYVAVWSNGRLILATRFNGDGTPRDILPIFVATGIGPYDVADASGIYFVAYVVSVTHEVMVRRVGAKTAVLDASPHATGLHGTPRVVSDGTNVAVITSAFERIGMDGEPAGAPVTFRTDGTSVPAVARHDGIVIQPQSQYEYTLIDWNGTPIQMHPCNGTIAASDGSGMLFINAGGYPYVTDANGTPIAGPIAFATDYYPVAVWDGTSYVVVGYRYATNTASAMRIGSDGSTSPPTTAASLMIPASFASNGTTYALAATHTAASEVLVAPSLDGFANPSVVQMQTARAQTSVAAASSLTNSVAVWLEQTGFEQLSVRAAVLSGGAVGPPIDIDTDVENTPPAIASDGGQYLMIYAKRGGGVARTLSMSGRVGTLRWFAINAFRQYSPGERNDASAATWNNGRYVVAIADTIAMFDRDGMLQGGTPLGFTPTASVMSIACAGVDCTLAWRQEQQSSPIMLPPYAGVFYTTFATNGITIPPASRLTSNETEGERPLAYRNATASLTIYPHDSLYAAHVPGDVFANNVSPGTLLGGTAANTTALIGSGLYWIEGSDGATAQPIWSRIDTQGTVHLTNTVELGDRIPVPVAATANATTAFLIYEQGHDDLSLLAPRFYVRAFATPDPLPLPTHKRAGGK